MTYSPNKNKRAFGTEGEILAREFLAQKGLKIIENNFRTRQGEIDIIAEDNRGVLRFIEVKSASSRDFGHPSEWVDKKKQKQLVKMIAAYTAKKGNAEREMQVDVVAIYMEPGKSVEIEHLENVLIVYR